MQWPSPCVGRSVYLIEQGLPVDTWDFDATLDALPAVRRMCTIGLFVVFGLRVLDFPYIPGGLGACACLVKFVLDEIESGAAPAARRTQRHPLLAAVAEGAHASPLYSVSISSCWVA